MSLGNLEWENQSIAGTPRSVTSLHLYSLAPSWDRFNTYIASHARRTITLMGYSKDFVKGLGWIGFFRMAAKAIVFFKIIVAYRELSPREVGLFGLAAVALGLLEMMTETGINIILVKDTKPISYYLDTAYIVSIVRGILIGAILLLLAFILPSFFRDDGLFSLLLLAATIPVIKGFINPAIATYTKELHFEREAFLRIGLILFESFVAIALVWRFHSAEMLIIAMIVTAAAEVLYSFLLISERPKLSFSLPVYREIMGPGKWVNLAGIITYAEQNFDNIIVGRILGATALGYYQTAFNLTRSLIAEVGTAFSQVMLPIYGRFADDPSRITRAALKLFVPAALLMLFPAVLLNIPLFQEFLIFFLQEKWRPALVLLPYLSVCAWLTGMDVLINPLFIARNQIRELVIIYMIGLSLMIITMLWFSSSLGLTGAALAVMISRILLQPLVIWRTVHILKNSKGHA